VDKLVLRRRRENWSFLKSNKIDRIEYSENSPISTSALSPFRVCLMQNARTEEKVVKEESVIIVIYRKVDSKKIKVASTTGPFNRCGMEE
jgi:hypothetical protein